MHPMKPAPDGKELSAQAEEIKSCVTELVSVVGGSRAREGNGTMGSETTQGIFRHAREPAGAPCT